MLLRQLVQGREHPPSTLVDARPPPLLPLLLLNVQPGARNANIQLGSMAYNGIGILFQAGGSTPSTSLSNIVFSHISVIQVPAWW